MKIARLLIANRGEIACRVIRTCRRLGVRTIAVHSEADRGALHVRLADEARAIGPAPARESYLNAAAVIEAARDARADAIHPGYGFLSENAAFAEACAAEGIIFVGPPPAAMRAMGLKHEAKRLVSAAGVPVVPGYLGADQSPARLAQEAAAIGFPLLVKAVAGGGGKGMRVVRDEASLDEAIRGARGEAESAFGDGRLMLERFLERPRHVEVQVFGDAHGGCVHLFERECSVQRRYQKIIEESPFALHRRGNPHRDDGRRRARGASGRLRERRHRRVHHRRRRALLFHGDEYAPAGRASSHRTSHRPRSRRMAAAYCFGRTAAARAVLRSASRVMPSRRASTAKTRVAVSCPRSGASGASCIRPRAELAHRRRDRDGDSISVHYDPMIAKVIASGADRASALATLRRNLDRTAVFGVANNLPLLRAIAAHPAFAAGDVDTGFVDRELAALNQVPPPEPEALLLAASLALAERRPPGAGHSPWSQGDGWRTGAAPIQSVGLRTPVSSEFTWTHAGDGIALESGDGAASGPRGIPGPRTLCGGRRAGRARVRADPRSRAPASRRQWGGGDFARAGLAVERSVEDADAHPASPLPGRVVELRVKAGDAVVRGDVLAVVEGMKMQHAIRAGRAGRITNVLARAGELVEAETVLFDIDGRDA
jgi:3-methylcrotonyl-CoA carboxylase alpha subunit